MSELPHPLSKHPPGLYDKSRHRRPRCFPQFWTHLSNTCDVCLQVLHYWVRVGRRAYWPYCTFPDHFQPGLRDRLFLFCGHPVHMRPLRLGVSQQQASCRPFGAGGWSHSLRARLVSSPSDIRLCSAPITNCTASTTTLCQLTSLPPASRHGLSSTSTNISPQTPARLDRRRSWHALAI